MKSFPASETIIAELAVKNIYYRLFNHAPSVLTFSESAGRDILEPFLDYVSDHHLTMNWSLHVHLLNWLIKHPNWQPLVNVAVIKELLTGAVTRWSLTGLEHLSAKGMMVVSKHLPGTAVGIWKSDAADRPNKVVTIQLSQAGHPGEDRYAISTVQNDWREAQWMALPK